MAPADGAGTDCTALIALQLLTLGGRAAHERSEFNEVHGVKSKTKGEGSTYLSVQDLHIRYRKIKRRKKVSFYIWQDCYIAVSLCDCTLPKHVLPSSTTYIKMKRCPDMAPSYPRIVRGKSLRDPFTSFLSFYLTQYERTQRDQGCRRSASRALKARRTIDPGGLLAQRCQEQRRNSLRFSTKKREGSADQILSSMAQSCRAAFCIQLFRQGRCLYKKLRCDPKSRRKIDVDQTRSLKVHKLCT